ncbi:MAG: hypothetical protein ABIK89_23770 [Planctomycetota bacterium]
MFGRIGLTGIACVWGLFALCVTGCGSDGPDRGRVSGEVKLNGDPLPGAELEFQPDDGSPSYGTTDEKGKYDLMYTRDKRGAMIGEHTVRITTTTAGTDPQGNETKLPQVVPPKYNSQSELKKEVKPGKNKVDFELTDP